MNEFAPVVIFVYRRCVQKLIQSLLRNPESANTNLIIFSDGAKDHSDAHDVELVRSSLSNINGFKSVTVHKSELNIGLANNIITGVTNTLSTYKRAIILEDDLIVSSSFLKFMNESLNFYERDINIWSISGYCPNINNIRSIEGDLFLAPRCNSWGWATWESRWLKVDWNNYSEFKSFTHQQIIDFESGGNDLYLMLRLQYLKKINSWVIRWIYAQYLNKSFSVYPKYSLVSNNGFDDDFQTHTSGGSAKWTVELYEFNITVSKLTPNTSTMKLFKEFHNLNIYTKIGYFLRENGGYHFAKKVINLFK